jgi:hypothetical protein
VSHLSRKQKDLLFNQFDPLPDVEKIYKTVEPQAQPQLHEQQNQQMPQLQQQLLHHQACILVDNREINSGVITYLRRFGVRLEFRQLAVGDYIVSQRIGVERKSQNGKTFDLPSFYPIYYLSSFLFCLKEKVFLNCFVFRLVC